jgi:hypothetical protein
MTNLHDRKTFLAALVLASVLIPGAQGCTSSASLQAWLDEGPDEGLDEAPGDSQSSAAVRVDSLISDQEMENFLLNARVVTDMPRLIPATTMPMPLEIEWEGEIRKALFKYGHLEAPGPGSSGNDAAEGASPDSYRHEIAAYRLDRALGLEMVPVSVVRNFRQEGALMEWVSGSFTEEKLRKRGDYSDTPKSLIQQRAAMRLFDALILNVYREESDQLITPGSWKLHLIDHSRAFGTSMRLPESFDPSSANLPASLLKNLENLKGTSLRILLEGLVNDRQILALLSRRDEILKRMK